MVGALIYWSLIQWGRGILEEGDKKLSPGASNNVMRITTIKILGNKNETSFRNNFCSKLPPIQFSCFKLWMKEKLQTGG